MKPEEAYNLIELCLDYDKDMSEHPEKYEKALQIAKEIFEKQDPMKVTSAGKYFNCSNFDIMFNYDCPNCGDALTFERMQDEPKYCPWCGHKLDWSEKK